MTVNKNNSSFKQISIILEDNRRFSNYFKKTYPTLYWCLPVLKLCTGVLLFFLSATNDFTNIKQCIEYIIQESHQKFIYETNFATFIIVYFYLGLSLFQFITSMIVIFHANKPIQNKAFQIGRRFLQAGATTVVGGLGISYGIAYGPLEPNPVSNYVHANFPGGRGYDFEKGDPLCKFKGHLVTNAIGPERMQEAAKKYSPDSRVIGQNQLDKIVADPEYRAVIDAKASVSEKMAIGIPLVSIAYHSTKHLIFGTPNIERGGKNSEKLTAASIKENASLLKDGLKKIPNKPVFDPEPDEKGVNVWENLKPIFSDIKDD